MAEFGTLSGSTAVDGMLGLNVGAVGGTVEVYVLTLLILGLATLAVFALDAVEGSVVVALVTVNLDEGLG